MSLPNPFPAESGKAYPRQIMQEMVDIPAAMPAGTDKTNSKRHSRHTTGEGEKTVVPIELGVNYNSTLATRLTARRPGPYSTRALYQPCLKKAHPAKP